MGWVWERTAVYVFVRFPLHAYNPTAYIILVIRKPRRMSVQHSPAYVSSPMSPGSPYHPSRNGFPSSPLMSNVFPPFTTPSLQNRYAPETPSGLIPLQLDGGLATHKKNGKAGRYSARSASLPSGLTQPLKDGPETSSMLLTSFREDKVKAWELEVRLSASKADSFDLS